MVRHPEGLPILCRKSSSTSIFIRELPIEVHSKFIEQTTAVIKKILDVLLPTDWVNTKEKDFSDRYYLKKINVYTQIRILDEELKPYLGYDECTLTLEDAGWLKWLPEHVIYYRKPKKPVF